ncbi:MAG: 50S ribosomal protein L24 [Candidatus Diapherotrites archaeon]
MKTKSKKPKVQRKALFTRPMHARGKDFSANLSKELRKSLGRRSLTLRKGDKVKVMRGKNRGFGGKITKFDSQKKRVFIEKLARKKADGTERLVPINASKVMIVEIDRSDDKRVKGRGEVRGKGESQNTTAAEVKGSADKGKSTRVK